MDIELKLKNFETFARLKNLCKALIQDPKNIKCFLELKDLVDKSTDSFVKAVQPTILSTFYPIIKTISEDRTCLKDTDKEIIVSTLSTILNKLVIDKLGLFFNIYAFLLFEIYDHVHHKVLPISEEYKLSIINCSTALAKCVSSVLLFELYTKKNAPKLCQMLYVAIELAKNEQLRSLRLASIECIMAMARVLEDDDFNDIVVRNQVAELFLFFLPGIAYGLKNIALEDEKVGHKVSKIAVKAWGRIVTLLMQDYNSSGGNSNSVIDNASDCTKSTRNKTRWKNNEELNAYIENTKRSPQWYSETDKKLENLVVEFSKLTHHSHPSVRMELTDMCHLVIKNCLITMPRSASHLIEFVITLSEDDVEATSDKNTRFLEYLGNELSSDKLKTLLENLEEGFYCGVCSLPRKFNGIDEREHLTSLNLLIGYLKLFGKYKLSHVLLSGNNLTKLMETLLYISELKNSDVGLMEEYSLKDLNVGSGLRKKWKNFQHFKEDAVQIGLERLCSLLGQNETFHMICDYLLDVILFQTQHRREAIFILNGIISGCDCTEENLQIFMNIKNTYLDSTIWQVPVEVCTDEFGNELKLNEVQYNVIQVCLLVEGIGKLSSHLRSEKFLLDTLYLVLEKAGSSHILVRSAGLLALQDLTSAYGYADITTLINNYIDYFTFYVERKLKRIENIQEVLCVLEVVMKYTKIDILPYIADIISEVLLHSCDKFKERYATDFLRVFKTFIHCILNWFDIKEYIKPIKSRQEKQKEIEDFQVSGIEEVEDFSDDIMEKSAEELFQEDMAKKQEELEMEIQEPEVEGYKKPDPPLHVKLAVAIIARSLQFLPSKNQARKLLTLDILLNGLEIVRDWEDELLPLVHQIWSPLVERFKEFENPLILNYSFQLLVTLAKVSKEFIRMRTTKEVLPNVLDIMLKLANESYLKDKGSAYRYSQSFKLQLTVLTHMAIIVADLDIQNENINKILKMVYRYLSDKQPVPLQNAALECVRILSLYDLDYIKGEVDKWTEDLETEFQKNVLQIKTTIENIVL